MERRQVRALALGFGFYSAVAGLFAVQKLIFYTSRGDHLGVNGVLVTFLGIYTWAALTPVIFWVSRRWPLDSRSRRGSLLAHVCALLVLVPTDMGVYVLLDEALQGMTWGPDAPSLSARFFKLLAWGGPGDILWYAGVVAVAHAMRSHQRFQRGEIFASRLEARLASTRLQVLRTQLQPHFLFNTLHAVSALLHDDPPAAKRMLGRLASLLWLTLRNDGKQEVSLREELEMLDSYLEIQLVRFADRLTIQRDVAPAALTARVPNLILQPLVENAIRHGISRRSLPGRIDVLGRLEDGRLRLEVRDNGAGLPRGSSLREGVGLSNTRARLQQLYGSRHLFELGDAPGGGLSVVVEIPYVEVSERAELAERVEPVTPRPPSVLVPSEPLDRSRHAAGDAEEVMHAVPALISDGALTGLSNDVRPQSSNGAPGRPEGEHLVPRGWKTWGLIVVAWLLFGLLLAGQALILAAPAGAGVSTQRLFQLAAQSLVWSAYTAFILVMCQRFPLGRASLGKNLAAHALMNAALFLFWIVFLASLDGVAHIVPWAAPLPKTFGERLQRVGHAWFIDNILRYWLVVGIGHALAYQRMARQRELEASLLETRVVQSELELLTLKLQPHFLFDTLRAISARVDEDPRGADRMLTRLGDILRMVLEGGGRQEVPLVQELLALDPYIKIQEARFRERLRVRRDIAPDAADAAVPNLVLQALVDHAVRHGTARRAGPSWIEIRARRRNGALELVVQDGGEEDAPVAEPAGSSERSESKGSPGPRPGATAGEGALADTRARLQQLYGPDHRFELTDAPGRGLRIGLEIPYRLKIGPLRG
jgi:LytS/YehU family sensor histidine kinase